MSKKFLKLILLILLIYILVFIQNSLAAENEYGIVTAWFNDEPATIEGVDLRINEPFIVEVNIESKIDGNVYVQLYEPGVTMAYEIIKGPSEINEWIYNTKIMSGWSETYTWKLKPDGNWTNGNAPINLIVQFNKNYDDVQSIEFSIANPTILDEQYSGSAHTTTDPSSTDQTPSDSSPGFGVFASLLGMALVVIWKQRKI